jgi:methyl-accepting chemotaxis protein
MKNISIRTKLLVAFSALFLLIVAQGIFSIDRLSVVNGVNTEMKENQLPSTRYVGAMNITAARFRISEARHILAMTNQDMDAAEGDMNKWLSELTQIEAKYAPLAKNAADQAGLQQYRTHWAEYLSLNKKVLDLSRTSQTEEATSVFREASRDAFNKVITDLEGLIQLNIDSGVAASAEGDVVYGSASRLLIVLGAAGGLFAALACWMIISGVSTPIRRMTEAMQKIAGGDKTAVIPALDRGDEMGAMAKTLEVFKASLIEGDRLRAEQEVQSTRSPPLR